MTKITSLLAFLLLAFIGNAQSKITGTITLPNNMTADFTLNNSTAPPKVTLILTGPSDRWFGFGIGMSAGFGMSAGDVLIYTNLTSPALTDRRFIGFGNPAQDGLQDWTTVSDGVSGPTRTLTLTRDLTNSDTGGEDFQMPYATTNSFSIVGVRGPTANNYTIGSHGGSASAAYATATFTTLGTTDFSLNASSIYPNPSNGTFKIATKTALNAVTIYSQSGALLKTIKVDSTDATEVLVNDLQTGVYLLELQNDNEKIWKKVVVE